MAADTAGGEWKLPWAGGCRCGALRFAITQPPMLTGACHCTGCQKMSASAYSLTVTVPQQGFAVTEGEAVIGGLHGAEARHHHCGHCLSWVYTTVPAMDWFVNVRATMLDDAAWFRPYMEVWRSEGLPWAQTGAVRSYPALPEMAAFEELMADFARDGARPG